MKNLQTFSEFINEAKSNDTRSLREWLNDVHEEFVDMMGYPESTVKKYLKDITSTIEKALGAKENKIVVDDGNFEQPDDLTPVAILQGKKYGGMFGWVELEKDNDGYLWCSMHTDSAYGDPICIRLK